MTKNQKFTFVYAKSPQEARGWWLKLSDMESLENYILKTQGNPRMEKAFNMYRELYDKGSEAKPKKSVREMLAEMSHEKHIQLMTQSSDVYNMLYGAIMQAENVHGTILDGFRCLNMAIGQTYINHIKEDGVCFINKNGGCNAIIEYDDWCTKDDLVWPDFKKDDIRVKQFPGGEHWYAYIGSMEVHNGDTLRFASESDARSAAIAIINKS